MWAAGRCSDATTASRVYLAAGSPSRLGGGGTTDTVLPRWQLDRDYCQRVRVVLSPAGPSPVPPEMLVFEKCYEYQAEGQGCGRLSFLRSCAVVVISAKHKNDPAFYACGVLWVPVASSPDLCSGSFAPLRLFLPCFLPTRATQPKGVVNSTVFLRGGVTADTYRQGRKPRPV